MREICALYSARYDFSNYTPREIEGFERTFYASSSLLFRGANCHANGITKRLQNSWDAIYTHLHREIMREANPLFQNSLLYMTSNGKLSSIFHQIYKKKCSSPRGEIPWRLLLG